MDTRKNITVILAASLAALAILSCKKDEEEQETLPSLSGIVRFEDAPDPYLKKNATITVKPYGVKHPEGKSIGYYCKASWKDENDTIKFESSSEFIAEKQVFTLPEDSLGTFSITCTAFASGYYSTSSAESFTTVDPEESMIDMELGFSGTYGKATDDGGREYRTVKVEGGSLIWFAENLAYAGPEESPIGIAYENAEAMSDIFGRFYTWEEALTACPDGWRLPTEADWLDLAKALSGDSSLELNQDYEGFTGKMMVDAKFNSKDNVMWEYWPDVRITNSSGLSMIPCGFANIYEDDDDPAGAFGVFSTVNQFAAFWTGTGNEDYATGDEPGYSQAYFRYMDWNTPLLRIGTAPVLSFATTVRCVRDAG